MNEFAAAARAQGHADPAFWKPAKLLATLAAQGRSFEDEPQTQRSGKEKRRG
jgi:hypothetical protein